MFDILDFIEKKIMFLQNKLKCLYWKAKYGKRIKLGKNLKFRKRFNINLSKTAYLEIGDDNFFNNDCSINCHNRIIIGNKNLFGETVKIYDHNHVFNDKNVNIKTNFKEREIIIGNVNWIGSGCVLLSKTMLGNNNVVAANTVVNEKIGDEYIIGNVGELQKKKIEFK